MKALWQDLRYALRALRRAPGFAAAALLTLAAGIGLSLAVLSVVEGGLRREHPFANPSEILGVEATGGLTSWTEKVLTPTQLQAASLNALLTTLLVLALFVLAIACSNVTILLLSRAATRRQEIAVRATIGARPGRIARQLFAEGAVLGIVGGGVGLLFGLGGIGLLRKTWPDGLPLWLGGLPQPRATAASIAIPVAMMFLFTLAPAFVARRRDLRSALSTGTHATATPTEGLLRHSLVVLGVAATALLLTGAGLLFRAAAPDVARRGLDANAEGVLTMVVGLPEAKSTDSEKRLAAYEALLGRVGRIPGIRAESIASPGTWVGLGVQDRVNVICGRCVRASVFMPMLPEDARHHVVGPGYFDTVGVAIVSGREFTKEDRVGAPGVAIVNEAFRASFERADPIGKKVQIGGFQGEWYTIVGVVREPSVRGIGSGTDPVPALYLSAFQHPPEIAALAVRTTGSDPLRLAAQVQGVIRSTGPGVNVSHASTLDEVFSRFLAPLQWFSTIFMAIAALAVLLSAFALYGVVSYNVRRRTREIGIRMALGARRGQVRGMVVRQSGRLALVGGILGLAGAVGLARILQQLFFGVEVFDLHVHGAVGLLLMAVAILASWRPAHRAARVDPVVSIRTE